MTATALNQDESRAEDPAAVAAALEAVAEGRAPLNVQAKGELRKEDRRLLGSALAPAGTPDGQAPSARPATS